MKYKDHKNHKNQESNETTVNGIYVGIRHGGALRDALAPESDGYDHLRKINHVGSMLQDGAEVNSEPLDK